MVGFATILLIKVIWFGASLNSTHTEILSPPQVKIKVETETSLQQCKEDGVKWYLDSIQESLSDKNQFPLSGLTYECRIEAVGGEEA